jgi:hypothetical protein
VLVGVLVGRAVGRGVLVGVLVDVLVGRSVGGELGRAVGATGVRVRSGDGVAAAVGTWVGLVSNAVPGTMPQPMITIVPASTLNHRSMRSAR